VLIVAALSIHEPIRSNSQVENANPTIAQLPRITFEGTVTGLSLDTRTECFNTCPADDFPQDAATIRLDKIINVDNPTQMSVANVAENQTIGVSFWYSARPAVVISEPIVATSTPSDPNASISSPVNDRKPATYENGHFTFTIPTQQPPRAEDNLPGLQVGNKIRATLTYGYAGANKIGSYEVIQ
jgi:hypothetical protein